MSTVFSHIVQKRLSQESEHVATSALEYILDKSESARSAFNSLFKGISSELPRLYFRTQDMDGSSRPDMWGYDDQGKPRVFIENKFWAGLTDNQPVSYLEKLRNEAAVLLFIVPETRLITIWNELKKRVTEKNYTLEEKASRNGVQYLAEKGAGPIMGITSWSMIFAYFENLIDVNDHAVHRDLLQLKALCEAEDGNALFLFSAEELTDQRTPATIFQLASIVTESMNLAVAKKT